MTHTDSCDEFDRICPTRVTYTLRAIYGPTNVIFQLLVNSEFEYKIKYAKFHARVEVRGNSEIEINISSKTE